MTALGRYIFRQLLLTSVFIAVTLALIVTLFGSLRLVDFIVNRGLPVSVLFELSGLRITGFFSIVLPIAIVTAVLIVYNKLLNDSELIVMRAAGLSQWALAKPALVLAGLGMLLAFALNLYLSPLTYSVFKERQFAYRNAFGSILLQERKFNSPKDGVTVYIRSRDGSRELRGVFAHDERNPAKPVTYLAERGTVTPTDDGMRVVMFNGSQQIVDKTTGRLTLFYFDQYSLDLGFLAQSGENRWQEPSERYLGSLLRPDDTADDRQHRRELIAEGHRRLSSPLYILVFTLAAICSLLIGDFNRRGQTIRILTTVGIVTGLQLLSLSLFNISRTNLAFVPIGYALPLLAIAVSAYALSRDRRRQSFNPFSRPALPGGE